MAGGKGAIWGARCAAARASHLSLLRWRVRKEIKWHQWGLEEVGRFAQAALVETMK